MPPNCRFEVDDINDDWAYSRNKFDFVHVRWMTGCVPDWTEFHKKALKYGEFSTILLHGSFSLIKITY